MAAFAFIRFQYEGSHASLLITGRSALVLTRTGGVEKVAKFENDMILLKYLLAPSALPQIYDQGII